MHTMTLRLKLKIEDGMRITSHRIKSSRIESEEENGRPKSKGTICKGARKPNESGYKVASAVCMIPSLNVSSPSSS
jgi:hypothetical protein